MTPPRASLRDRLLAKAGDFDELGSGWGHTSALLREAADALPEGWVLVPRELLADVEEQLIDLFNEKSANRGLYREREKLHDADVLQRVRLLLAAPSPTIKENDNG